MGTDLALANRIWLAVKVYTKGIEHDEKHIDYYTTVMVVALLLQDELLAGRIAGSSVDQR